MNCPSSFLPPSLPLQSLRRVSPGPRFRLAGVSEGNRGRACPLACVRRSEAGESKGAWRARGGARGAAGGGSWRAPPLGSRPPPRARAEWFDPTPRLIVPSPHAGPRWRRRWASRVCDSYKEGSRGPHGSGGRGAGRAVRPLPSAPRPPAPAARLPAGGPAPPPTVRLAWCGGRARRHGRKAGAEAQVAGGRRARCLPVAAAGLRECAGGEAGGGGRGAPELRAGGGSSAVPGPRPRLPLPRRGQSRCRGRRPGAPRPRVLRA